MATAAVLHPAATTMNWPGGAGYAPTGPTALPIQAAAEETSKADSSGGAMQSGNPLQASYTHFFNPSHGLSSLDSQQQQPASSSSSLFSRSELQAIDGFLESFSAPLSSTGAVSSSASTSVGYSAGYPGSSFPQAPPYSASTAFYRPEWRGGPPSTIASSAAPTLYNNQRNKYVSYHPTAYHRPSSPSSASASSSSYPKTLGQADQHYPASTSAIASGHGAATRPARLSNSPFSSTSHAEESPDEREKRLKNQAEDLAGWLSRYKQAGRPSSNVQSTGITSSSRHHSDPSNSSSHQANATSPLRPVQGPGPSSTGSTSNSESLPTPSSRVSTRMPYLDFVASESADMKPTNVRPSDMSLSKAQPAMVHTYVGSPGLQARLEHKEGEQTTETSAEPEISNVKEKASKATRPSKKKTSSTTTSIREKKQPLPKVPTRKVSKSETPSATSASAEKPSQSPAFPEQPSETINLVVQAGNSSSATTKTALTEEQKRANHIASEQKRRHAIRAAYDALCTVVPSLRAAVQEYEERLSKLHPSSMKTGANAGDEDGMDLDQQPTLQTVAGVLTGGIEVGGEKIDGRAGPRSEAVVLAKTVEYMRDLLDQREESIARLQQLQVQVAKQRKPVESPSPHNPLAPWNAKWTSRQ